MRVVCLDLEGVLIPEIWLALADRTGLDALRLTTRDIADYDELMARRLAVLNAHDLRLGDLRAAAAELAPLDGAAEFLARLRERAQVAIVSDTFYELADPLMAQLGRPMLICHSLRAAADGRVADYAPRQRDPKRRAAEAFLSLNSRVAAAGDSHNDIPMLEAAHAGFLFRPPGAVARAYPQFPVCSDYDDLSRRLDDALDGTD